MKHTEMFELREDYLIEVASVLGVVEEVGEIAEEVGGEETAGPVADVDDEPVEEDALEGYDSIVPA